MTGPVAEARIVLDRVSKRYEPGRQETVLAALRRPAPRHEHWALRDVDLSVQPGEAVAVLGRNGAGKTTLLRTLAGVTQPTSGRVSVRGRIAPLISVGVGFHEELSGAENVAMNGALLGLSRAVLRARMDEIVAFSELDPDVLSTPVKFYSSGMRLRLAFAVAVQLEPDVLLVDEVLAVGDLAFQAKCLAHLRAVAEGGATVVLVTHSTHAARLLCSRALVLAGGQVRFDGPCDEGVAEHHRLLEDGDVPGSTRRARVVDRRVVDAAGRTVAEVATGAWCQVLLTVQFEREADSPQAHFTVHDAAGEVVYELYTRVGESYRRYAPGERATVQIGFRAALAAGEYVATTGVLDVAGREVLCQDAEGVVVRVRSDHEVDGIVDLDARITVGTP